MQTLERYSIFYKTSEKTKLVYLKHLMYRGDILEDEREEAEKIKDEMINCERGTLPFEKDDVVYAIWEKYDNFEDKENPIKEYGQIKKEIIDWVEIFPSKNYRKKMIPPNKSKKLMHAKRKLKKNGKIMESQKMDEASKEKLIETESPQIEVEKQIGNDGNRETTVIETAPIISTPSKKKKKKKM